MLMLALCQAFLRTRGGGGEVDREVSECATYTPLPQNLASAAQQGGDQTQWKWSSKHKYSELASVRWCSRVFSLSQMLDESYYNPSCYYDGWTGTVRVERG